MLHPSRRPVAALAAFVLIAVLPAPAHAAFGDQPLRRGSHGQDVRVLQRWLTLLGFEVQADGAFGERTARAVRGYEQANGLRVDGRVSRSQARGLRARAYAARGRERADAGGAVPAARAVLAPDGRTAVAPPSAPVEVKAAIAAANAITDRPYRYGGGHGRFEDRAYDCSGAVSYALRGGGLLARPADSTGLMRFGEDGPGVWISVYAHATHAYVVIAGLRFDTSGRGERGPRWRPRSRSGRGYEVRHPVGL